MDISFLYSRLSECHSVSTDTRTLNQGAMFFALKGETYNGNHFAAKALELGAKYAVVDEQPAIHDQRFFLVEDSLKALQLLSNYHRRKFRIPVIGLTGSNGKTTTKELIAAVLQKKYNVLFTKGNLNNHIGVPVTLLKLKKGNEIAVVEMGANHIGEIAALCNIAEPTHGMITNIGKAHLEGFGGIEGVIKAKTEMYDWLKKSSGTIFVNASNNLLVQHIGSYSKVVRYGLTGTGSEIIGAAEKKGYYLSFKWKGNKEKEQWNYVNTKLTGEYNLENVLSAICIGRYFDVAADEINAAIENYIPSNQRSQIIKSGTNTIMLDAYNANPSSVAVALKNFRENFSAPHVVFLGDMLELGKDSKSEHDKIISLAGELNFSHVILSGKFFGSCHLPSNFRWFNNSDETLSWLKNHKPDNASILIKGSRGMKMEKLMEAFSERT